ncbi:MAG: lipocalin family protein [Bacteroides sp.]|nr:lipocalin family protein [Bacteroides sp.]MCM1530753.1 lipocalin family protein [Ruminococcus flavefaciens]MCM1554173.1 lipocalin family protein [Bacteroides sp.]
MKKLIFSVFALTVCALAFVSCKKDDDGFSNNDIVGTWEPYRYYDNEEGEWDYYDDDYELFYRFRSNGTGLLGDDEFEDEFDYSIKGKTLYIDYGDNEVEKWTIESITSGKMMWRDEDYGGDKLELRKR